MRDQSPELLEYESIMMDIARKRLRRSRWLWCVASVVMYIVWDLMDTYVLNRYDPFLGGIVIDWSVMILLGVLLTLAISHWEDRQLERISALAARNAAAERAAIQLEAAQATARSVAHHLNQPLAIIRVYAELLCDAPACERSTEDLLRVIKETDRAAEMVRQLLQITHYETTLYPGGMPIIDLSQSSASLLATELGSPHGH